MSSAVTYDFPLHSCLVFEAEVGPLGLAFLADSATGTQLVACRPWQLSGYSSRFESLGQRPPNPQSLNLCRLAIYRSRLPSPALAVNRDPGPGAVTLPPWNSWYLPCLRPHGAGPGRCGHSMFCNKQPHCLPKRSLFMAGEGLCPSHGAESLDVP